MRRRASNPALPPFPRFINLSLPLLFLNLTSATGTAGSYGFFSCFFRFANVDHVEYHDCKGDGS